ncbi:MAG: hypothetical protein ACREIA_17825, partial [Opitutaceae bacterium]
MLDNQYHLFRNLDRRCVAGGLMKGECAEAVRLKRASIESDRVRSNPLVQDVLAGRTTFVATYDAYSRAFRGLRRFMPLTHDDEWNGRLEHLAMVLPNVRHFMRRSLFALDNPVVCTVYSLIAATGVACVLAHAAREDEVAATGLLNVAPGDPLTRTNGMADQSFVFIFVLFAVVGFMAGVFSMLKYRTRDSRTIHAREAAAYMDLNFGYYRI